MYSTMIFVSSHLCVCVCSGQGAAGAGDGGGEAGHGPRGPVHGGLQPGVGGVLQPGALPARPEPLHPRQPGQQEGPHRVPGEEAGGKEKMGLA